MPDIVLTTINAKYIHASFGLRCLQANLGPLASGSALIEFESTQRAVEMAEIILAGNPRIVGIGVYIWNAVQSLELAMILKRLSPGTVLILGGPEVSHETEGQPVCGVADFIVTGEADLVFQQVCQRILAGAPPAAKIIHAPVPDLAKVAMPYGLYSRDDIANRVVYVEASRGCAFTCEFCLSSLDVPVRAFPMEPFLGEMQGLLDQGLLRFKFVDRTFNLNLNTSKAILRFFLERMRPGLFLHFEMIPDRLPEALREWIEKFPPGVLQFEVGIQSFNHDVSERISRRQNVERLEDNFRFLRSRTGVHIHADLIVGLPGEDMDSFAAGFDRLLALGPQEIQIGMLKRLRGTPIIRHDREWSMVYNPAPPYEILSTGSMPFAVIQELRRFSRHWDLVGNSGNFNHSLRLLWRAGSSPFRCFLEWSRWLHARTGRAHGIALDRLAQLFFEFLESECLIDKREAAEALWSDYQSAGRSDAPPFLREWISTAPGGRRMRTEKIATPKRQGRHLGAGAPAMR